MLRSTLAVVVGSLVGGVIVWLAQSELQPRLFDMPGGVPPREAPPEVWTVWLEQIPLGSKLFVIVSEAVGAMIGALTASALVARGSIVPPGIVALIFFAATISNLLVIPHPAWMNVLGPLTVLGGGAWGATLLRRPEAS